MTKVYLVRHGESQSNIDSSLYFKKDHFDHKTQLSEKGQIQAQECNVALKEILKGSCSVFVSPYQRAQETMQLAIKDLNVTSLVTDVRLREQEFKDFPSEEDWRQKKERAKLRGKLFYRFKNAESGADVVNRVSNFYNQLRMDILMKSVEQDVVIICHEIVIRSFLTVALKLDPQEFENLHINNCEVICLEVDSKLNFKRKV